MFLDVLVVINEKYDGFSKVNKILADYVIEHHSDIVFMTIVEFSEKAKVSPASVTRFAKELGYKGFPGFQKDLQSIVKKEVKHRKASRMSLLLDENIENVLPRILDDNIENLRVTNTEKLSAEFEKAVNAIMSGKDVYILGLRSSYAVAYYFYFLLREIHRNVHLITLGTGDIYDRMMYVDDESVLVAVGFPKYSKDTCEIAQFFKSRNAPVIAVTDNYSSPLSVMSDITLIAPNQTSTYSFVSAMSILNAIVVTIGRLSPDKTLEVLEQKEALLKEMNIQV